MDATAVEDRPMIRQPEQMKHERDEVRRLYYPDMVEKREGGNLPKNVEQLRQMLDVKVNELANKDQADTEKEHAEIIPEIVLRTDDEKTWKEVGWEKEKRDKVRRLLEEIVGLKGTQVDHAIETIVGKGLTPEQAEAQLTRDKLTAVKEEVQQMKTKSEQALGVWSEEQVTLAEKTYMLDTMGLESDYIKRFILHEDYTKHALAQLRNEYSDTLQAEFDNVLPRDLFDLAWNIGFENKKDFGVDGRYPVMQMQVHKSIDPETGKEKVEGRWVVNQGNFLRWMRLHIWNWYDEFDTDEVTDYFSKIEVKKGPFYSVNLVTMLFNKNRYFRDETGHMWQGLYEQTLLEPWMMMFLRTYYLEYEKAQGDEGKLSEAFNNVFYLSKLTRKIFGRSMIEILMTLPMDYHGKDSDTQLGEAWKKMYLGYYTMADFQELKEVMGEESSFFKLSGWQKAMEDEFEGDYAQTGMPRLGSFLSVREEPFLKAFTNKKTGELVETIQDEKAFIEFVNIYTNPTTPSSYVQIVNKALRNSVAEKFVSDDGNLKSKAIPEKGVTEDGRMVDEISLKYAWLIAHSWSFFTGTAAKNNFPGVSGHNAETKWLYPQAYRIKYIGFGGGGNPYTVGMFKQLSLPLMEGILLENVYEDYISTYENGKPVWKKRQKTPMEVFRELHRQSEAADKARRELRKELVDAKKAGDQEKEAQIQEAIDMLEEKEKNRYKLVASQLVFHDNAMRNYAQNIIGRGKVLYETVMGGHEIDFDKFTKYDGIFRGVSFDRAEFQKAVQSGMITPLRYLFEANGATQLNMMVRTPVYKGINPETHKPIWKHEDVPLAEAMLGYEIVNIPKFRKTTSDISPEDWQNLKAKGFRKRGKYIIRPDGRFLLDANKMQEDKTTVYKQWMLMKLGADLWSHIDKHSTDPAYNMEHYQNILEAIEKIPGEVDFDQNKMRNTRITHGFFSHEQMRWLKMMSGSTRTKLFTRQFFADLFQGDKRKKESTFGESASIILSSIFRGY